ncbi:MAG: Stp1/IreP family PP2C-type Ser/Thr phosphatase [Gemmatimonadetes bacterium]|jgi:PPM family protein phosphatase|nr:Stp1/IreP family PP2C-type Ser/Thr phosphatase [Gemmatimonadota bacterium]
MNIEGKVEVTGLSDVGRKRSHNEDSIGSDTAIGLTVLADGMGGYKAGEVASAMAVNGIMEVVRDGLRGLKHGDVDEETGYTRESLLVKSAVLQANHEIHSTAESQPQCQGMGTTLVAAMFYDDRLTIAHVGDSRMYRARAGGFEQITVDHSLLQELVDKGFYTPEEAKQSLNKNLVTRAMGIESTVVPDVQEEAALPGDIYLLCSDGLTDLVEDEEIRLTVEKYSDNLDNVASALVKIANEYGGKDNISVILARVLKPYPSSKRSWYSRFVNWFS